MLISIPSSDTQVFRWQGKAVLLNGRFGVGRSGRLYTKTPYKEFINDMAMSFCVQHKGPPITSDVGVLVFITPKRKSTQCDTDAYNKQIFDALEEGGVLENDNQIKFQATVSMKKHHGPDTFLIYVFPFDVESVVL